MNNIDSILLGSNPRLHEYLFSANTRAIYFPSVVSSETLNHFLLSQLVYDRVTIDAYTFFTQVLFDTPKSQHETLLLSEVLDLRTTSSKKHFEVDEIFELRPEFSHKHGYTDKAFNSLYGLFLERTTQITQEIPEKLAIHVLEQSQSSRYDLLKMIVFARCNYLSVEFQNADTRAIMDPSAEIVSSDRAMDIIFQIHTMPDLAAPFLAGKLDINKYLALRDKRGMKLLRSLIFNAELPAPHDVIAEYMAIITESVSGR